MSQGPSEASGQWNLLFLTSRGTLASCPRQEETRDKRVPVLATGSGPLAGKLASEYPVWSGCQSQQRRVPTRVAICCRKGDPFQGPKLRSYKWIVRGDTCADKARDLIGKGTQVKGRRVREPGRTALFWKTKVEKGLNTGLFNFNSSAVKELHYDSNKKLSFFWLTVTHFCY